eukprot:383220_1
MKFLNDNELDSDAIVEELENRVMLNKQKLIKFGMDNDYYNKMYEIIRFYYTYKQIPTAVVIENLLLNLSPNKCIFDCQHIANVMQHELYTEISDAFRQITKHFQKYKTIGQIINQLQKQTKID